MIERKFFCARMIVLCVCVFLFNGYDMTMQAIIYESVLDN